MDAADVGRYGTLRVLKRLEDDIVACYPIDDEEVTIGRDPSCNLRLYYESVSSLHCKVIFRERKAFLEVLGANGLLVDGCAVFPASSPSSGPVIVPLPNNSIIEIHKKRFQFCYPPKELRPILLSTPSRPEPDGKSPGKRKLRMSMIHSAQVFSPRPSPNPRENLRILQTPLKTPFRDANRRQSSPLKRGVFLAEPEEEEDEDEDIVLVETNYPRVVEEDEDLVITEHVVFRPPPPEPPKSSQPHRVAQFPIPQAAQPPPQTQQTPRRRPHSRASLHRAVLIRSAQRTALRREMEEEEEVEEVEETINELDEDEEMEEQDLMQVDEEPKSLPRVSGWKKSLEVVKEGIGWPFRSSSVPRDVQEGDEDEDEQGQEANEVNGGEGLIAAGEENDAEELFEFYDNTPPPQGEEFAEEKFSDELPLPAPTFSSAAPALGRFMTPQAPRVADRLRDRVRYSMGGFNTAGMNGMVPGAELASSTGPRRVKIVEPWRVEDLVVPSEPDVKEEDKPTHIPSTPQRHRLTEEERRAIQERRRSALTMPDTFTPGSKRILSLSPVKAAPIPALNISIKETIQEQPEEGEEDTEVMLARMKQMVDSVKKRQSMGLRHSVGFGLSPKKPGQFSLLASDSGSQTPGTEKNLFDLAQRNDKVEALSSGDTGHDVDALLLGYSEDVNMDTEEEHDVPQQMHLQPSTFQPTGVREFFRVPDQTAVHTPRMDGMRELFRTERNTVTPTFEGIGDMLATPAGYRETIQPQPATSDGTQDSVVEEEGPTKPIQSRLRKPATLGSRLPATRRTAPRSAPARGASPLVPEDEPAPAESSTSKIGPPSRVTRKPRSKTVNNDNPPARVIARSTRARDNAEKDEDHKRTNSAPSAMSTAEPEPEEPSSGVPKLGRRTRKTAETSPPTEDAPPARSLRKPRTARTPVPETAPTPSEPRSTRRGTRAKPIPVEEEDELDVIPREPSPDKEPSGTKVRRSARTKVKEEEPEDSPMLTTLDEVPEPTTKGSRTRKIPGTKTMLPTTRSTGRGKAAASSKKAVVDESPASGESGDKENTPEPEDEVAPSNGKAKVTRKATRARAATEEREELTAGVGKTRVSRAKTRR